MKNLITFSGFWIIAFIFYFKTAGAGFVADTIGWFQIFQNESWQGLEHTFGDKALHYVYQFLFFICWKIFALNGYAWMILFTSLHAAIATLSLNIFTHLFSKSKIPHSTLIALCGSLMFIISPYFTEPLVWYACIHYLVATLLILSAFRFLLSYVTDQKRSFVLLFYLCFLVSLFTLEISFVLPLLLLIFFLFWPEEIFNSVKRATLVKLLIVPSFCLIAMYLLLSKFLRGSVVGHYGAATHLNFNVTLLMGNLAKYILKVFFLFQFFPFHYRQALYHIFEKDTFAWSLFVLLIVSMVSFLLWRQRFSERLRIAVLLFTFFLIGLMPILSLYITYVTNVEGDRFTYFASIFGFQFLSFFVVTFLKKFGWVFLGVFVFFEVQFLWFNTESWKKCKEINQSLTHNFRWYDSKDVFLLSIPDNFRGAYFYRGFPPDNSLQITLSVQKGQTIKPVIHELLLYNMDAVTDSVIVQKISDDELQITFAQWGNWWWKRGIGADSYATNDYNVEIDPGGHSYRVKFKRKMPGSVYLYQCGSKWRQVEQF